MSAYGWVILCSFLGPFFLSFDRKVAYFRSWKYLIPSLLSVGIVFLLWDECFTQLGVWGFTSDYLLGIYIGHLPLEEVLFFLVIPYNFIFILLVLKAYFPNRKTMVLGSILGWLIGLSSLIFAVIYLVKPSIGNVLGYFQYYTISATSVAFVLTLLTFKKSWYGDFALSFLICLIPFFIVNGILTGSITEYPIVWYSAQHIIGFRLGTIPFEDLFYNYDLLLPLTWLFYFFQRKRI